MSNTTEATASGGERVGVERLVSVVVAFMIGTFLILGVGFVGLAKANNAAHDNRHAFAFPNH
jgi:cobalt transporter subunit CbtB